MGSDHPSVFDSELMVAELVRAHSTGRKLAVALPAPDSPCTAMDVQARVQKRLGESVKGWKVAIGPQQLPVAAPLLSIYSDGSEMPGSPNCLVEVELAVRLSKDIPAQRDGLYARGDILDSIESAFLGIEVVDGRFDGTANVPFLTFLADHLGNRAYVVGDSVPVSALDDLGGVYCQVALDGLSLHEAPAVHPVGDPLLPLLAYANAQIDDLGGLKAGQVVTTGSLCGVLPVRASGRLTARLGGLGEVSARFLI